MSQLPKGWVELTISDLADVKGGKRLPKGTGFSETVTNYPYIRVTDFDKGTVNVTNLKFIDEDTHDQISNYTISKQDLYISIAGTIGLVGAIPEQLHNANLTENAAKLCNLQLVDKEYLKYFLQSPSALQQFVDKTTSSGQPKLALFRIKDCTLGLPPLAEQTRIVEKLDEVLAQVDTIKARLDGIPAIIKRFRQSVLATAVSGKLTEEWRIRYSAITTSLMLENFEELPKPARYKTRSTSFIQGVCATAVGKPSASLVESWEWVPLVSIARMESGHTPSRSKSEYWGGDVKWIGIKDARRNHACTIIDTEQKTNPIGLENSAARLLPKDTICISRTASVGYVTKMGETMATSQDFVNWVPSVVIYPDWLKWLFVAEKESLFKFGRGSTHTTVYFPEWLSMHICLPPIEEQKEIVRLVDQYFAFAETIEAQVKKAQARVDNLTQSILAKAFRGELVPQDPSDEPADKLLERIAQARKEAEALAKATKKIEADKKRAAKKASA